MSKIAKALEKAKRRREGHVEEGREHVVRELLEHPKQQPVHSQTRVVSLDSDHLEKHGVFTLLDDPQAIDTYNVLCTQVLERTRGNGDNTIMVTSCVEDEGKSVTAINLAVSIASRAQHTVLLVDLDLRSAGIQRYLGLDVEKGIFDFLYREEPMSELLINPGLPKMVVLPVGKTLRGSTEILSSPKIENLVHEMKNRYKERYVILDCPPLLQSPDALVVSSYADGIILVVEAGKTSRTQISNSIELLNGRPLLGLVMNKALVHGKGYYYGR